jgi:hypothetical protein
MNKPKINPNFYKKCFCLFCLSNLTLGLGSAAAKGGAKSHPIKKLDTTPNNRDTDVWGFTLETNMYRSTIYFSPVLDFSSKNGWDIQIASYNIPVYGGGAQNYEWDSYINLSKTFEINDQFKALLGTQNGTTLFSTHRQFHNVEYALAIYQPLLTANLHAGPYWANKALTTTTDVVGYTAGFSAELIKNKRLFKAIILVAAIVFPVLLSMCFMQFCPKFKYISVLAYQRKILVMNSME